MRHQAITNDNNACGGCQRVLPTHLGIHTGEFQYLPCTRSKLELESLTRDVWHQPSKRVWNDAPFTFVGSK